GFVRLMNSIRTKKISPAGVQSLLSETELSVALCAARGMRNKEIADKVCLSESRVKTCLSGVYRKLGITEKKEKRYLLAEMLNI
ncbi:MAG: helix-turn-helix transcriptional regulator, partial [Oscillospiraceae bacterium]|nr:helix-turn-helix transcriptional regulator [Oscillospiraceae bacterium]